MSYNFNTIDGLFRPNYKVYNPFKSESKTYEPSIEEPIVDTYKPQDLQRIKSIISDITSNNDSQDEDIYTKYNTDEAEPSNDVIILLSGNSEKDTSVPSWVSTYKGKQGQWLTEMWAAYKKAGLSDNAIRNLLAKNSVESNWGESAQGAYNFGNITTGASWKGNYVVGTDYNASGKQIRQKFRTYNSLDEYVADEIQFLTQLYEFNPNDDFETFVNKLQGGNKWGRRYAESPSYTSVLKQRYNKYFNGKSNS